MDDANHDNGNSISSSTKPGLRADRGISSRSSSSSSINSNPGYALNGKIMLCTVVVLFFAVVVILGFHTYTRWLFRGRSRRRGRHPAGRLPLHQAAAAPKGGLDAAVLKSLSTFTFYADGKTPDNNLGDCPVCLSEFEDGEAGRALPKCRHAFHVECIDMWFETHSNCPICRAPVQAPPDAKAASVDQAVPLQDNGDGNSSSSNSHPAELVGISVEAPPLSMEERFRGSTEEQGSGSDGGNRAKSPSKPVLSMKRIWSV